ncbi:hypothetical protein GBAR_LOCUS13411 [Geodia barretti]|uniref:Uncharacterized protein n=1 Tax=Geodia barretti TaxID=519541 RepID=A0AA35WQR5_GEOBA|nr:hypothetical protein GBAR_LOCUS13411 [Geodia barretti]
MSFLMIFQMTGGAINLQKCLKDSAPVSNTAYLKHI